MVTKPEQLHANALGNESCCVWFQTVKHYVFLTVSQRGCVTAKDAPRLRSSLQKFLYY